jgi:hypothetical protein
MDVQVELNRSLVSKVESKASSVGISFSSAVEQALRLWIASISDLVPKRRIQLPKSGSGGVLSGIDLDRNGRALDRMEGRE